MSKSFRTLDDVDVKGKRVLLRVDLNVPMENGHVTDATRLERIAPTIIEISDKGGKVILLAHFGRPKGREAKDSLKPVAAALAQVIKRPVAFADECVGEVAARAVAGMKNGDILCLENTRFHKEEEKNDPAFVADLAKLGDGRRDALEPRCVADAPVLHGHVEVDAQQHAFALHIDVVEGAEFFGHG